MGHNQWFRALAVLLNLSVLTKCFANAEDDGRECDLSSASRCMGSSQEIFQCFLSSSAPGCSSKSAYAESSYRQFCDAMNYTLNSCFVDLLAFGCESTPQHGFYLDWLNPMNAVLNKLCSRNESILRILAQFKGSECLHGEFINCLFETDKKIDVMGLITSEMVAGTCSDLDVKLQMCQVNNPDCKSMVDIVLALGKVFLDNAVCKDQPLILVPLEDNSDGKDSRDDRDCAPGLASQCFDPMLENWNCYFQGKTCSSNFTEMCSYTDYALNTCGLHILGYGCENNPQHQYYKTWLDTLNLVYKSMCGKNNLEEENIASAKTCWFDLMKCVQTAHIADDPVNLITNSMTGLICSEISDSLEFCATGLLFPECDNMLNTLELLRTTFVESCKINEIQMSQDDTKGASHSIGKSKLAITFIILNCVLYLNFQS